MADNKFNLNDYIQVNDRIIAFYDKYPQGSIQTEIVKCDDKEVIFKAYAYRSPEDNRPATGHARELEGSTYINKTSHIENCETSAVGRALAMLGFEIKKSVASREEVENARIQQSQSKVTIDGLTAKTLEDLIKAKGGDLNKTLKHYRVNKLTELTPEQAGELKTMLSKAS